MTILVILGYPIWSDREYPVRTISISHLKARLSEQLRYVKEGERILVTERGRPVAELAPVSRDVGPESLEALVDAGLVRRGHGQLERLRSLSLPSDPESRLLEALLEERLEGR